MPHFEKKLNLCVQNLFYQETRNLSVSACNFLYWSPRLTSFHFILTTEARKKRTKKRGEKEEEEGEEKNEGVTA